MLSQAHGLAAVAVRSGRVHEANAAASQLFGDRCVGMDVDELFGLHSRSKVRNLLSSHDPEVAELELLRSGEPVVARVLVLTGPGESLLVVLSTDIGGEAENVTNLREANRRLVSLTHELASLVSELDATKRALMQANETERRLRADLEELGHAGRAISEAVAELPRSDIASVLHMIALQARALTHADYVALGIGTDPANPFQPWVSLGVSPEIERAIGRTPRPVGLLGAVARDGEVLRIKELERHPRFEGFPPEHPRMGPLLGVPIHYRGRPVGNLYLANKPGSAEFSEQDEHVIGMLAARVGVAVETALLYVNERGQRAWLQDIIDQMPDGIVLFDERGRLKTMNQAGAALCCESTGRVDPLGNPVILDLRELDGSEFLPEALPSIKAIRDRAMTVHREALLCRRDGQIVAVSMSAVPVRDADGRLTGVTMIIEDISRRREAERMREEWAAVVAHDLRQPLGTISLAADMLLHVHSRGRPEPERRMLERIRSASGKLDRMISDLTQASLLESRRLSVDIRLADVGELVASTVECLREEVVGHDVVVDVAGEVLAWIDRDRIQQVIANLVSNAAKYGDPETEIRIDVHRVDDSVEVTVTNHGPGISPEQMPLLFSKFMRTREARSRARGLGLGLYIAKGLVDAHGGRLWAESVPGETTSFHFTLRRGERSCAQVEPVTSLRPNA